jgi:uncharacterized hydrophobic protein (TIGR00341 family)
MPTRLLEVTLPREDTDDLISLLEEQGVERSWTLELLGDRALTRFALHSQRTEQITDLISDRFAHREDFNLMLLPVEAAFPAIPEPEPTEPAEGETQAAGSPENEKNKPPPLRVSREELYQDAAEGARLTPVFLVTVALSTVVAAVGLIRNDVAVIIGAMVIAPLLGPNVSLSLAVTLGDPDLARQSLRTSAAGAGAALLLSLLIGAMITVDPTVPSLFARAQMNLGDVVLALASGSAGALAYTAGLSSAVVGVMVAVALLPPLVTAGLMLAGGQPTLALGAFLLVVTNVACLNLAGVATFLAQRVGPRTWWEAEKARKASRRALAAWILLVLVLVLVAVFWRP